MKAIRRCVVVGLLSGAFTSAAVLAAGGGGGSESLPGWNFGVRNCGCLGSAVNPTLRSCLNCCTGGQADQVLDCQEFCRQAIFPCTPPCPWWNPFCW